MSGSIHVLNSSQEDEKVVELVRKYGPKRWSLIAQHLKGRIGKQCRERYSFLLLINTTDTIQMYDSVPLVSNP